MRKMKLTSDSHTAGVRKALLSIVLLFGAGSISTAQDDAQGRSQRLDPGTQEIYKILASPVLESSVTLKELKKFLLARVPPLQAPADAKQWDAEAQTLRGRFLDEVIMKGHDPNILAAKPGVQWQDTIETGKGYVIRKLCFEIWPGLCTAALLYEPVKLEGKVPVVLFCPGHAASNAVNFHQLNCINLAKRGMIVLTYDQIGSGQINTQEDGYYHDAWVELFDLCGRAGVAPFYTTIKRGIDILLDHPHADPSRVAATGVSGGGWQSIMIGALDPRVTVSVPVAGYVSLITRVETQNDVSDNEVNPCDFATVCDYTHLTAMRAPRPTLIIANKYDDCCYRSDRARPSVYEPVIPIFKLYGKTDDFGFYEGSEPGHNYDRENRQAFYKFLNQHFFGGKGIDAEIPSESELQGNNLQDIKLPKDNMNVFDFFNKYSAGLPEKPLPTSGSPSDIEQWTRDRRVALRENVRLKAYAAAIPIEVKEIPSDNYIARRMQLKIGEDWHVPAVEIAVKGKSPKRVAIVFADGGRTALPQKYICGILIEQSRFWGYSYIDDLIKDDYRCLVVDLVFNGECYPTRDPYPNYEYFVLAFGERPLGLKIAQLRAVYDYVIKTYPGQPVTILGAGPTSSVVAVLAAALSDQNRPDAVVAAGLPASLRVLAERSMWKEYSLFNFGLLKEADVCEMLALALPARIQLLNIESSDYQVKDAKRRAEKALTPFVNRAKAFKQEVSLAQEKYQPPGQLLLPNKTDSGK